MLMRIWERGFLLWNQVLWDFYWQYFEMPTTYSFHPVAKSNTKLNQTIKSVAKLSHINREKITDAYTSVLGTRSLRLFHNNGPFMGFNEIPSGRLHAIKHRVNLRKHSFRLRYLTFLIQRFFNFNTCKCKFYIHSVTTATQYISHLWDRNNHTLTLLHLKAAVFLDMHNASLFSFFHDT